MDEHATTYGDSVTVEAHQRDAPAGASALRVWLVVAESDSAVVYELPEGAELTIGRARSADIVCIDSSLSRLHARIRRVGAVVQLTDLHSRNGCWVGGRRVTKAELRVGDIAVLGGISLSVQLRPSCEPALFGVSGAASIMQYLEAEIARCRVLGRPLSVLAARAARPAELPLPDLAAHCADLASPIDRIGLYDRELLIAVLPETDLTAAARRAQQIVEAKSGGVVCGIASLSASDTTADHLVSAAVRALRGTSPVERWVSAPAAGPAPDSGVRAVPPRSSAMLEVERLIERLAPKRIAVLVLGETGTGKELIARELHARSRRPGPLKVVNCAAIPAQLVESVLFGHVKGAFTGAERDQPGLFLQAHRGTIFLDEVGELSPGAQAALLRTLDSHCVAPIGALHEIRVDVRVVAATHRDLAAMTADGTFRLDLYHRLNSVILRVPPLRERLDELEALIELFVDQLSGERGSARPRLSQAALARLRAYPWPGNVRELRNVIDRALAIRESAQIELIDLPVHIVQHTAAPEAVTRASPRPVAFAEPEPTATGNRDLRARVKEYEARLIGEALRLSLGNQRRAAGMLRVPLRTFERKVKMLGVDVGQKRRD